MSQQTPEPAGDDAGPPPPRPIHPLERRVRRTALSTGFSDVPGKTCEVCGYEGFRWQAQCPEGHPLA